MLVDPVRHPRDGRDVPVVPEAKLDVGRDFRAVVELDLLGAHDRPTPFRLHPPHVGERGRVAIAHPVAVRDLVEAVAGGDGSDPNGLEQDVEAVIDGHGGYLPIRFGPRNLVDLERRPDLPDLVRRHHRDAVDIVNASS